MRISNSGDLPSGDSENPVLLAGPRHGVPAIIDTPEAYDKAINAFHSGTAPIAADVERAHGFRYGADPYLIQLRREDVGTFLIDPTILNDLSALTPAASTVWLLHDAEQDLPNLRQVGLEPQALFDTMMAARLVGSQRFGLAAITKEFLGLALAKEHQASDWSVRPLPTGWLRYAALDVEVLTELYRKLATRLHDSGRWEWAEAEFAHILTRPRPEPKTERWRKVPGKGALKSRRNLAILRELWLARERIAEAIDMDPNRLLRNSALIRAAAQPPRNRRTLLTIQDFRSPLAREHTDQWMRAINRGRFATEEELPSRGVPRSSAGIPEIRHWNRLDPEAFERLRSVRFAIAQIAEGLDLDPEILLEPKVQRYLCWAPLEGRRLGEEIEERLVHSGAREWQRTLCTDALIDALST
ncbi:HRDC domain-containing protein [Schaalia sp. Marseille-Q2122]|uniref:HRDC domain-containing protein n=1 Tax=Schaalia sp. Marseille-Q2122 TaxID=2736604 RepID=UPI001589DBA9|nr:HRDC domain-containing protein [Schaalia sp. Marseille-Q2122]